MRFVFFEKLFENVLKYFRKDQAFMHRGRFSAQRPRLDKTYAAAGY
jgi:hypothetical protein